LWHTLPRSTLGYPAWRCGRGGTGAGHGEATQSLMIRPVQKMVLLRAEKGPGVRVTHWRPERSASVMVPPNGTAALPPAASDGVGGRPWERGTHRMPTGLEGWSGTRPFGDAKGSELRGKNHRIRGTETCLTGCREAVITNVARQRAPADHPCASGKIGNVHGQATGRNGSRERRGMASGYGGQLAGLVAMKVPQAARISPEPALATTGKPEKTRI
jgi:hypothetical protein